MKKTKLIQAVIGLCFIGLLNTSGCCGNRSLSLERLSDFIDGISELSINIDIDLLIEFDFSANVSAWAHLPVFENIDINIDTDFDIDFDFNFSNFFGGGISFDIDNDGILESIDILIAQNPDNTSQTLTLLAWRGDDYTLDEGNCYLAWIDNSGVKMVSGQCGATDNMMFCYPRSPGSNDITCDSCNDRYGCNSCNMDGTFEECIGDDEQTTGGDADSDSDTDSDTDADSDTDTDSDTDSDTDLLDGGIIDGGIIDGGENDGGIIDGGADDTDSESDSETDDSADGGDEDTDTTNGGQDHLPNGTDDIVIDLDADADITCTCNAVGGGPSAFLKPKSILELLLLSLTTDPNQPAGAPAPSNNNPPANPSPPENQGPPPLPNQQTNDPSGNNTEINPGNLDSYESVENTNTEQNTNGETNQDVKALENEEDEEEEKEDHQGFYANAALGMGLAWIRGEGAMAPLPGIQVVRNPERAAFSLKLAPNIGFGFYNIALHMGFSYEKAFSTIEEPSMIFTVWGFGGGVSYYFQPHDVYLTGQIKYVGLLLFMPDVVCESYFKDKFEWFKGPGFSLTLGKEWFGNNDGGVGIAAQGNLYLVQGADLNLTYMSLLLLFTATKF